MESENKMLCRCVAQPANDLPKERCSELGVIVDEPSHRYVRWCQDANDDYPRLSIEDCYKILGVRRTEVPNPSRLRASIGRNHASTRCIPLDDDFDGKIVVRMTIPVLLLSQLLRPLSDEVRTRVQTKLDGLVALVVNGHRVFSPHNSKTSSVDH